MHVIHMLLGEHAALLSMFEYVERMSARWTVAELRQAAQLVEASALQHAVFEDELLFDAMPLQSGGVEDTLKAMRREHEQIPEEFARFYEIESSLDAKKHLTRIFDFIREHFALEERVMFSLAEKTLGTRKLEEQGARWAQRRKLTARPL